MSVAVMAPPVTMTTGEALDAFLQDRHARQLSKNTLVLYERNLRPLRSYFQESGPATIDGLTIFHCRAYLAHQIAAGVPAPTLSMHGATLRAFVNWAASEELINEAIPRKLKVPKIPRTLIEPFSSEQLSALIEATTHAFNPERERAIILTLIDSGMRANELCQLKDEDVQEACIRVLHAKGRRPRMVPIGKATAEAIKAWQAKRGPNTAALFTTRTGQPIDKNQLLYMFKRLGKWAEITGVRCSPHTVRHSTATQWIRGGGSVFELMQLLGHSVVSTTERYVKTDFTDVAATHRNIGLADRLAGVSS